MSALLFGQCGCCGGLYSEAQSAYAFVPYWMGMEKLTGRGSGVSNRLATAFVSSFPQLVYLTYTEVITLSTGETATAITSYDIYGKLTTTTDPSYNTLSLSVGSFVSYGTTTDTINTINYSNGTVVVTLTDPYSYADAVSNALKLLDQIALLNPARIYTIAPYGSSYYSGGPIHFCYGSEASAYPGQRTTNILYVSWDINGNPVFAIDGYGNGTAIGSSTPGGAGVFGWNDGEAVPSAMNGFITTSSHTYGGSVTGNYMDVFVVVKKQAVRSPTGYIRRDDNLANLSTGKFVAGIPAPVTINAGENLFYPSDVPGYGMSYWSNNALPTLPPV